MARTRAAKSRLPGCCWPRRPWCPGHPLRPNRRSDRLGGRVQLQARSQSEPTRPVASGCDKPGGLLHPAMALAQAPLFVSSRPGPSDLPRVRFSGGRNTTRPGGVHQQQAGEAPVRSPSM